MTSRCLLALVALSAVSAVPQGDGEYVQLDDNIEPHHALWEGSLYTYEDRDKSIMKGITFLESQAGDEAHFIQHARDYMLGMQLIAQSSHNRLIINAATRVGKDMAERWQKAHVNTDPSALNNDELRMLTGDIFNGNRYGIDTKQLIEKVSAVLSQRKFSSFFNFNPLVTAPQDSIDKENNRPVSKWEAWQNALIFAYVIKELKLSTLEGGGEKLFQAVVQWLPGLRPHTHVMDTANFIPNLSAVLQLVYVLSDYEFLSLDRELLPDEYGLLEQSLPVAIDYFQSVEAVGELVDCLKTFGDKESSPNIQRGITYLIAEQNADGSWGGDQEKQLGIEHHTTIVALWGLRERMDHGKGPKSKEVLELLQEQIKKNPSQISNQAQANHFANNLAHMMQLMGMPLNLPPSGVPGMPAVAGMPQIPGMPHNPFANFHTTFSGDGNAPVFEMNDAQKKYMETQQKAQQDAYANMQKQMEQHMQQQMQQHNQAQQQMQEQMKAYQEAMKKQQEANGGEGGDQQQQQQQQQQAGMPFGGAPQFAGMHPFYFQQQAYQEMMKQQQEAMMKQYQEAMKQQQDAANQQQQQQQGEQKQE